MTNHKILWEKLISTIFRELTKIDNQATTTVEDIWIKGTLLRVLREMCALHRLPPKLQKIPELTRPLFEGAE